MIAVYILEPRARADYSSLFTAIIVVYIILNLRAKFYNAHSQRIICCVVLSYTLSLVYCVASRLISTPKYNTRPLSTLQELYSLHRNLLVRRTRCQWNKY